MNNRIVAICGPTASGKTAVSIEIAKQLNGEIISCDSMQIYKYLDIGSAKPTTFERSQVKHHLIDFLEPNVQFSCVEYQKLATECIDNLLNNNKMPLLCGGTGLYLDSILTNNQFSDVDANFEYRKYLDNLDVDTLYDMLLECDPQSALKTHKNNKKRVIRALEIFHETGKTKTEWDLESKNQELNYNCIAIMLDWPREVLYERINKRVDCMMEQGLLDEAICVREKLGPTALQAIGYKELYEYLDGIVTLEKAIENIKTASRNYAKRQITWFKHRPYIKILPINEDEKFENIVNNVIKLLKNCE